MARKKKEQPPIDNPAPDTGREIEQPKVEEADQVEQDGNKLLSVLDRLAGSIETNHNDMATLNNNFNVLVANLKATFTALDQKINTLAGPQQPQLPPNMQGQQQIPGQLTPQQIAALPPQDRQAYAMQQLSNNPIVGWLFQQIMSGGGAGGFGAPTQKNAFEEIGKRNILMSSYMQMQEQKAIAREWAKQGRLKPEELQRTELMAEKLYSDIEMMATGGTQYMIKDASGTWRPAKPGEVMAQMPGQPPK